MSNTPAHVAGEGEDILYGRICRFPERPMDSLEIAALIKLCVQALPGPSGGIGTTISAAKKLGRHGTASDT